MRIYIEVACVYISGKIGDISNIFTLIILMQQQINISGTTLCNSLFINVNFNIHRLRYSLIIPMMFMYCWMKYQVIHESSIEVKQMLNFLTFQEF